MKKINNLLIGIEMIVILLPITLLLILLGIPSVISQLSADPNPDNAIITLLALCSTAVTTAVWLLSIKHLRGIQVINRSHSIHWALVLVGVIIVAIAYGSRFFFQPEPYSDDWWFFDQLSAFVLGAPLGLLSTHVLIAAIVSEKH